MALDEAFKLYEVVVNTVGVGASYDVTIGGITSQALAPNIENIFLTGAGLVQPTLTALNTAQPSISLTSTNIDAVLATIGAAGLKISADVDEPGAVFYFAQVDSGGTIKTGSSHITLTMKNGIAIPRVIRCPKSGKASVDLEFHAFFDGTNEPFIFGTSVALPARASTSTIFTVGKCADNTTQLDGVQDWTLTFNHRLVKEIGDGDWYPRILYLDSYQPVLDINFMDLTYYQSLGAKGKAIATGFYAYARKYDSGGVRVIDGTAEHVKLTMTEGTIAPSGSNASEGASHIFSARVTPAYDDTNAIVQINTASAIT